MPPIPDTESGTIPARSGGTRRLRPVQAYLTWLALTCLLPGIAGAVILFLHEYGEGRTQLEKDTIWTARALVQAVDTQVMKAQLLGEALAANESLARGDLAGFRQAAGEILERTDVANTVALLDEDARQLVNLQGRAGQPLPRSANPGVVREVFSNRRPLLSDVFTDALTGKSYLAVYVPAVFRGKVAYVIGVAVQTDRFDATLEKQHFPADWIAAIHDPGGTIVARTNSRESLVGKKARQDYIDRIRRSPEGVVEIVTRDGIPIYAIYSRSETTGWTVTIGIPRLSLERGLLETLALFGLGIASLFGIGFGLAWYLGQKIARSVKGLTQPLPDGGMDSPCPLAASDIQEVAETAVLLQKRTAALEEANRSLQAREREIREAHRIARLGHWYRNVRTGEIRISDSMRELCGWDALPPYPEQRGKFLTAESWERVNAAVQETLRTGIPYDIELEAFHGNGSMIWINTKGEVVRDADGEIEALRGTAQDITERKAAEKALQDHQRQLAERTQNLVEANQQLLVANRQLECFLYASSHDLKGPLGRISNFSMLLERNYRDRLEGDGLLFLDFIRDNALRLTKLIDELMDHARINRQASQVEPVDLRDAVQRLLEERSSEIRESGADLQVALPAAQVLANEVALRQVLRNLLDNALKYTSKGTGPVVRIGGETQDGLFRVWFKDSGIGFDMQYHDRIFEVFRRLHTHAEYAGTGIGLAIVKQAMECMGGQVWAESVPDRGATFYLEFRLAPPVAGPADRAAADAAGEQEATAAR